MIEKIRIRGLNGSEKDIDLSFNRDLNVITGQNGCGKTTLLKILWYLSSGHLALLMEEIRFSSIEAIIDNRNIKIERVGDDFELSINGKKYSKPKSKENSIISWTDFMGYAIRKSSPSTIFFPTFRRVEGGFSMEKTTSDGNSVVDSMRQFSKKLSFDKHKFVAYVSTEDLEMLLKTEYSKASKKVSDAQRNYFEMIRRIIKEGSDYKKIENIIDKADKLYNDELLPFEALESVVIRTLRHRGVAIDSIVIGDVGESISSDKLSAGEKQMLSFLCYNAFSRQSIFFIDEPELSLHPDWQRKLMPTLLRQNASNQFFIATHSPFVYNVYPDKEIIMDEERG